jgi:S1-C subfamily serine protease
MTSSALEEYANALLGDRGFTALEPRKPNANPLDYAEALGNVRDAQARTLALIAPETIDSMAASGWIGAGDEVGLGVVVSANGWILTTAEELAEFSNPARDAEVWIRGTRYPIQEVVADTLSEYVLLRLQDANNLSTSAFGASEDSRSGDMVFVLSDASGFVATTLQNSEWPVLEEPQTAEGFVTAWQLANTAATGPVLSTNGDLLAFAGTDGQALPLHYGSAFVQEVLRSGVTAHAAVGAYVVDLSHVYNLHPDLRQGFSTGALVLAPSGGVAVPTGTPAAAAGLEVRDIITAVDGEALTAHTSLSEILTTYDPGQTARLSVVRDGGPLEVPVVLGDAEALVY